MFDKLIESEPEGADFHNRRSYFMVSSLIVGALFLTAVVISIYASDYGLGNDSFELSMMVSPPDMAAIEPEPARPQPPAAASQSRDQETIRQVNMPSVAENTDPPISTSVVPNTQPPRPRGVFLVDPLGTNSDSGSGNGRNPIGSGSGNNGIAPAAQVAETETEPAPAPPPAIKKPPIQSLGVITGRATYLPKPVYPAAANMAQAQGKVDVQVMIDENGRVVSATAVSGHPLLRKAAEQAARNAVFSPTYLSKVPVKVTGVIVYNFTR